MENADKATSSALLSAILCDKETKLPKVVTVTNSDFGEKEDKITRPFKVAETLGGKVLSEKALPDGKCEITFRLKDYESIAFYA